MNPSVVQRPLATFVVGFGILAGLLANSPAAQAMGRSIDPAQVVPLDKIAPHHRDTVAEVIRESTFHRRGDPETFPCDPRVYLGLLNEPSITLALWKDLSTSPVRLRRIGPNLYEGSDGSGASATWEFVLRTPKLHVLLCNLEYTSPRGNAHLQGRIVLIVHTGYYREVNGEHWVQHDVEAYVKVDSKGWKTVARTIRPILEKVLVDQVREAGWFVSLMGRLVAMYPDWACKVTDRQVDINQVTRQRFHEVVIQAKRPGASSGRPVLAENSNPNDRRR